jgi:molybdopterin-guanine dinucleotide biosynthesis protein A
MGVDKATMSFGGTTLLQSVLKAVAPAVEKIVLVGQQDQRDRLQANLGEFSQLTSVMVDAFPDRGPLEGLRAGLGKCKEFSPNSLVFACGCDMPLISADVVRWMFANIDDEAWAAAPQLEEKLVPLPAVYRLPQVLPVIEQLLATGERSLQALLAAIPLTLLPLDALRLLDPGLNFLRSANTPADLDELSRIRER